MSKNSDYHAHQGEYSVNALLSIYPLTVFQSNSVMPLLLDILYDANGTDHRKLNVDAMECTGLIGSFLVVFMICGLFMSVHSYCRWSRHLPSGHKYSG
jgi:hypothetical protein